MSNLTTRWTFAQGAEVWTFPFNPDTASSPRPSKQLRHGVSASDTRARTLVTTPKPTEWTFSGPIRSQSHHEGLELWAEKSGIVTVSDHLGNQFEVLITSYAPEDRQPTQKTPWRMKYTMKALVLREIQ